MSRTILALVLLAAIGPLPLAPRVLAQVPATEEQALAIERQLMCPVCVNERLDVSQTAIAQDMKRVIREQLAAGRTPDDIILYFETRYGPGVRAELPVEGFNLFLYLWIGGVVVAVSSAACWHLASLRRRPRTDAEPGEV